MATTCKRVPRSPQLGLGDAAQDHVVAEVPPHARSQRPDAESRVDSEVETQHNAYLLKCCQLFSDYVTHVDQISVLLRSAYTLTLASLALEQTGEGDQAASLLSDAERLIRRARLNGVDDPNIYYSEGVVLTLRDDHDAAIQKLQQAYERGFREQWMLEIDGRLDPLRDRPEFLVFKDLIDDDEGVSEVAGVMHEVIASIPDKLGMKYRRNTA